jgi:hypothetical protein
MFCGRVGHLDEFCFRRKRIERRHFNYGRNSYRDEFSDFSSRSFSYALPHTSHAFPQFAHRSNYHSYGFGSRENHFEPKRFGYDQRPYRDDHFPRRPVFPAGGSHTHSELRHLDGPHFPHHGSRPTQSSDVV